MLSQRSQDEWRALVGGPDGASVLLEREALNPFLVGVHLRGEEVVANDLARLLDGAAVPDDERDGLAAYVEAALHLLDIYDQSMQDDDDDLDPEGDLPFGTLVI